MKKIFESTSPRVGKIIISQKYNGEKLLLTNGFSQGVSTEDKSIKKSYWYYQVQEISKHCTSKKDARVLWLGLGAGTGPILLFKKEPTIVQTIIEFDAQIIQICYTYFGLPKINSIKVIDNDAYNAVKTLSKHSFDAIAVDIYTNDAPVNGERSSDEKFLSTVFSLMKKDGIVLFNRLAHIKGEKERTEQLMQYLSHHFTSLHKIYIQDPRGYKNEIITAASR